MGQDVGAILNSPWFDRGLAVVLVFVLLRMMHDDIGKLTSAVTKLNDAMTGSQTAIVHRQEEIRSALRDILTFWADRFPRQ